MAGFAQYSCGLCENGTEICASWLCEICWDGANQGLPLCDSCNSIHSKSRAFCNHTVAAITQTNKIFHVHDDINIMKAARCGDVTLLRQLLENGANVDYQDPEFGESAMMKGAARGHVEIVDLLLLSGGNSKLLNNIGQTACMIAVENSNIDIENLLKQHDR